MGSKVADSHGVDKARKQSAQAKHAPAGLHAAQPSTPMDHVRVVAKKIMDSNYFSAFMTVLTIYALFGDDMKLTLTDVTADGGFVVAAWICVFFFSFEIMCNIFANPFYLWGFYFWIDLVSTLSILMEIPMVMDPLTGEMGGASGSSAEMAKAGKAGRVGTKASKVIRIVRLVRMVRVVKLYKMHNGADDAMQDTSLEPSSVGKKLTEITTQRLICMMLVMIMALPWLQSGSLLSNNFNFQYHFLKHLHQYPQNFNRTGADGSPLVSEADFRQQVRYYARKSYQDGYPLLYLEICEPQTETGVYGGPFSWANCNTTWTHDAIQPGVHRDPGGAPPRVHRDVAQGLLRLRRGRLARRAADVRRGHAAQARRRADALPPRLHGRQQRHAAGELGRRPLPRRLLGAAPSPRGARAPQLPSPPHRPRRAAAAPAHRRLAQPRARRAA